MHKSSMEFMLARNLCLQRYQEEKLHWGMPSLDPGACCHLHTESFDKFYLIEELEAA